MKYIVWAGSTYIRTLSQAERKLNILRVISKQTLQGMAQHFIDDGNIPEKLRLSTSCFYLFYLIAYVFIHVIAAVHRMKMGGQHRIRMGCTVN